jgi:hypothetical protein
MISIITHFAKTLKRLDLHPKVGGIGMFIVHIYSWAVDSKKEPEVKD